MDYAKPFNPPTNISANAYIVYEPEFSKTSKRKTYTIDPKFFDHGFSEDTRQNMNRKYPHSHKVLASLNSRTVVEIASLTKIMTCILAINICEKYKLNS